MRQEQVAQGIIQTGLENLYSLHCFGNMGMSASGSCARFHTGTAKLVASVCGYFKGAVSDSHKNAGDFSNRFRHSLGNL